MLAKNCSISKRHNIKLHSYQRPVWRSTKRRPETRRALSDKTMMFLITYPKVQVEARNTLDQFQGLVSKCISVPLSFSACLAICSSIWHSLFSNVGLIWKTGDLGLHGRDIPKPFRSILSILARFGLRTRRIIAQVRRN